MGKNILAFVIVSLIFLSNSVSAQEKPEFYDFFSKAFVTTSHVDTVYNRGHNSTIYVIYYPDSTFDPRKKLSQFVYTKDWRLRWYLGYIGYSDNLIGIPHVGPGFDTISQPYLQQVDWSLDGKLLGFRFYEHNEFLCFLNDSTGMTVSYIADENYDERYFRFNASGEKILEYWRKDSIGQITHFFSDNSVKEQVSIIVNSKGQIYTHGSYKCYHKNGSLFVDGIYKYSNEVVSKQFFIQERLMDSVWTYYDDTGAILMVENYKNGQRVSKHVNKSKYKRFQKRNPNTEYAVFNGFESFARRHLSLGILK